MNDDRKELWTRLERLALDDPAAPLPFSVRLARANGWSLRHAQRVIAEYKRFVFLAATAGTPVCPSEAVDEAWHLHLCYTRSYWDGLCRDVLGQPLHHEPTQGGRDQRQHHRAMYEQTLAAYRAAFDREPPADVWPGVDERFTAPSSVKVDRTTHWVVPKPPLGPISRALSRLRGKFSRVAGVAALAVVPVVGLINPLDLAGPQFLKLYVMLLIVGAAGAFVLRRLLRTADDATPLPALDPYECAVLAGGENRAVQIALSELVADGYVAVNTVGTRSLSADKPVSANHHPVVQAVHRAVIARVDASLEDAYKGGRPVAAQLGARLQELGLLETRASSSAARWAPALLMAGVLAFGMIKIFIGIDRDKPVALLGLLCLATAFVTFYFARGIPRTLRGERLLSKLRAEHRRLKNPKELVAQPAEMWPIGLGLFGLAALSMAPDHTADLYRWMRPTGSGGGVSGSSGCSGGGDGGGGGCGGGGCGGCGGGD